MPHPSIERTRPRGTLARSAWRAAQPPSPSRRAHSIGRSIGRAGTLLEPGEPGRVRRFAVATFPELGTNE